MVNDKTSDLKIPAIVIIIIIIFSAGIAYVLLKPDEDTEPIDKNQEIYEVKDINTTASLKMLEANQNDLDFVILDVRTPGEFSSGHLENATLLDFYETSFSDDLNRLDRSKTYLVYCRSGSRSAQAADIMIDLGFKDVYNMLGGIVQWNERGYKTVST